MLNTEHNTTVCSMMEPNPKCISADTTLEEAARIMQQVDCGILPVGREDSLEGVITDRDIVIRAVAAGKNMQTTKVRDCMTKDVCCCNENDTLEDAGRVMGEQQVSRVLVKNDQGNICGILTFGRILRNERSRDEIGDVVECAVGSKAA